MTLSPAGLDRLKRHEGLRLSVYRDQAGLPTIGYGHLIKRGESFATITEDQAEALLRDDLAPTVAAVNAALTVDVTQDQFDSLASLTFNIGIGAFRGSSVLKAINARADNAVIRERLQRWNKITVDGRKVVSEGLAKRRADEAEAWA